MKIKIVRVVLRNGRTRVARRGKLPNKGGDEKFVGLSIIAREVSAFKLIAVTE